MWFYMKYILENRR